MKKKLNINEKHVVNVLIFLTTIYGIIIFVINYLIIDQDLKVLTSMGFIVSSSLILFFGKETVFGSILCKVIPSTKAKRGITDGTWNIRISYKDSSKSSQQPVVRNGSVKITNSMVGVKIFGSKLIDNETEDIKKEGWLADDAELITVGDKEVLVYLYKIPKKTEPSKFDKAGIVVAVRKIDGDKFKGIFKDVSFEDDKIQREGEVILFPVK